MIECKVIFCGSQLTATDLEKDLNNLLNDGWVISETVQSRDWLILTRRMTNIERRLDIVTKAIDRSGL